MDTIRGWRDEAACRDENPELFFPLPSNTADERRAKAICWTCPVREDCLADALTTGASEGIWGGLTDEERRQFKQRRSGAVA
jgi:WhiB family redox-sensing transcriptional regulator